MISMSTVMRIIENWQPDGSITKYALERVYSYTNNKHLSDLILHFGYYLGALIIKEANGDKSVKYAFLQDLQLTLEGQLKYLETRNKGFAPNANYYAYVGRLSQSDEVKKELYRYIDMLHLVLGHYVWFVRKENQFKSTVRSITAKVSKTVSPVIAKIPEPVKRGIVRGFELGKSLVLLMAGSWYNVRNLYGAGATTIENVQTPGTGFIGPSRQLFLPQPTPHLMLPSNVNFHTMTQPPLVPEHFQLPPLQNFITPTQSKQLFLPQSHPFIALPPGN